MKKDTTELLMEILTVCSENKLSFTYQNGVKKNYVEVRGSEVIVNIHDPEDPNLNKFLEEELKLLHEAVQY